MIEEKYDGVPDDVKAKQEHIICAALYYDDGLVYEHQPKNIESGIVICGRRHHNCFIPLSIAFPQRNKSLVVQGFVTSKDRFVGRKDAAVIALASGQINDRNNNCLNSEDLY